MSERTGEARDGTAKPFMSHLMELRVRIFVCLFFLVAAMVVCWFFYRDLSRILMRPLEEYNASAAESHRVAVFTIRPTEGFIVVLRLGFWGGLVLAFPVIAWEAWRFVSPGLYRREKIAVLPVFFFGGFFFAGGCYFAYRYVLPLALAYLFSFPPELGAEAKVSLDNYVQFLIMIHVGFGVAFEMPLVCVALARLGLVTARGLASRWRYVTVGAFVIGAILTPPDVVTQLLMAGSLLVLYVLSIVLAAVFGRAGGVEGEAGSGGPSSAGPVEERGSVS